MARWVYQSAPDFGLSWWQRVRRFPRSPDLTVWGLRSLAGASLRFYLKIYHRLKAHGLENLPQGESFAMVANHASHLDAVCLMAALPLEYMHRCFPAAATDYWFRNPLTMLVAGGMLNALAMDRKGHPRRSLQACRSVLEEPGNVLILFPEGRRSPDGQLLPFRSGIGYVLAGTPHLVVPAYIGGTDRALPRGGVIPIPSPITVHFGTPRRFADVPPEREGYDQVTADLEKAIRALKP